MNETGLVTVSSAYTVGETLERTRRLPRWPDSWIRWSGRLGRPRLAHRKGKAF